VRNSARILLAIHVSLLTAVSACHTTEVANSSSDSHPGSLNLTSYVGIILLRCCRRLELLVLCAGGRISSEELEN
jgi:hypothetical protein